MIFFSVSNFLVHRAYWLRVREEMTQRIPYLQCLVLIQAIAGCFSIRQEQTLLWWHLADNWNPSEEKVLCSNTKGCHCNNNLDYNDRVLHCPLRRFRFSRRGLAVFTSQSYWKNHHNNNNNINNRQVLFTSYFSLSSKVVSDL